MSEPGSRYVLCRLKPPIDVSFTYSGGSMRTLAATVIVLAAASPLHGQTDYYNTDAGRPILIEDAYPVERYAFELQLAPVRLERERGGLYNWGFEPELAYGILPRTQLEIGFPFHVVDASGPARQSGLAGIELSVLHNLNVETAGMPALALAAEALLPVGRLAPGDAYVAAKGIATRTYQWARFHLNARYTFGPEPPLPPEHVTGAREPTGDVSRWMAGVAVDRTFPLKAMLLAGSIYAHQPIAEEEPLTWVAETGLRYQWNPVLAVDAGIAKRLTGETQPWSLTFGAAYVFAVRSLLPR